MLDSKLYLDNNNFIEIEKVNIKESRIFFLEGGHEGQAFQIQRGPSWKSDFLHLSFKVRLPNGTFVSQKYHQIFGSYYFLSENMIETSLSVMTWPVLISDFGGFMSIIGVFFTFVANNFNEKQWKAKQIRQLFKARATGKYHKLNLSFKKVATHFGKTHKHQDTCLQNEYFEKGQHMLNRTCDLFRLIKLIDKLHAAVSILIANQPNSHFVVTEISRLNSFAKTIWLSIQQDDFEDTKQAHQHALEVYNFLDSHMVEQKDPKWNDSHNKVDQKQSYSEMMNANVKNNLKRGATDVSDLRQLKMFEHSPHASGGKGLESESVLGTERADPEIRHEQQEDQNFQTQPEDPFEQTLSEIQEEMSTG